MLSVDPASFEDEMPALIDTLNMSEVEDDTLKLIVDVVFLEVGPCMKK